MVWIVDCNVVSCSAIFSGCGETVHFRTDTRIYLQTIKGWADAENVLRNIYKSPCSRSGKPAIFGFSVFWSIFSGYHLRIYIRLSPVNFTDIFNVNDRVDMKLPYEQDKLIEEMLAVNPNTVITFVGGSPVEMGSWLEKAKTVVWSWYAGMEGGNALAEVLFGAVTPSGKLPETFYKKHTDCSAHAIGEFPGGSKVHYAEGGTEYGHMETIQRADDIYGPYEPCPHNPILTHRDDTKGEIHCTGHADIVEDQNGNWWMVCLGTRCNGGERGIMMQHHLGRETFLTPVVWSENGWPIVGNNGKIALSMEGPLPEEVSDTDYTEKLNFEDNFSKAEFDLRYNYLRNPHAECYVREQENKSLFLKGTEETLNNQASPTWIGVRQQEFCCDAKVDIEVCETREGFRAGLTAFYNQYYHYEICVAKNQNKREIQLAKHVHDIFAVTAKAEIPAGKQISLRVESDKGKYYFYYTVNGEKEVFLGSGLTAGLSTEGTVPMSFTGTYLALFAENGDARFKNFSIKYKK